MKHLRATALAMGNKDIRYYLNAVYFENDYIVATDAHRLHATRLPYSLNIPEPVIVPDNIVKLAIATKQPQLTLTHDPATGWTLCGINFTPVDSRYPAWRRILGKPTTEDAPTPRGQELINAQYMYDVSRALQYLGIKKPAFPHPIQGSYTLYGHPSLPEFIAAVMPARGEAIPYAFQID